MQHAMAAQTGATRPEAVRGPAAQKANGATAAEMASTPIAVRDRRFIEEVSSGTRARLKGRLRAYSHSIVDGGLDEMSSTTRLMPLTSLIMRFETRFNRSSGR